MVIELRLEDGKAGGVHLKRVDGQTLWLIALPVPLSFIFGKR